MKGLQDPKQMWLPRERDKKQAEIKELILPVLLYLIHFIINLSKLIL